MNLQIFKGYERFGENYPSEAVQYAIAHKEEAIPELLGIMDATLSDAEKLSQDEKYLVHFPAVYLLAFFRETRAYEQVIRLAHLPDDLIYDLYGETVTEDLEKIFASVCDGDITPIKAVIENADLDEFVRAAALESLLILLNDGKISREELVVYFRELLRGKLEADFSVVWETLPNCCLSIHPSGLVEDLESIIADGKVLPFFVNMDDVRCLLTQSVDDVLRALQEDERYRLISEDDVFELETWVGVGYDDDGWDFDDDEDWDLDDDDDDDDDDQVTHISQPVRVEKLPGRNDPCPCGSGKKYKKCCIEA